MKNILNLNKKKQNRRVFERVTHAFITSHLDYCNVCILDLISHRFTACRLFKMQPASQEEKTPSHHSCTGLNTLASSLFFLESNF